MKTFLVTSLIALLPSLVVNPRSEESVADPLREVNNSAFRVGEYLKYRIHYGIINAGIAEIQVKGTSTRNGRPVYHLVGKGRSVGMAEWFFKTRDTYISYVDQQAMIPWEFIRDVDEGGYIIKRHLMFDHYENTVRDLDQKPVKTYQIPENAQDLLSSFYYARCLPTEALQKGEMLPVEMFLDHERFAFRLKYLGKQTIETRFGVIRCKKFIPVVQSGRVFSDKEGLSLWVTDDKNKIPVRLEAELAVGSIKMDLIEFKNNLHPIAFK